MKEKELIQIIKNTLNSDYIGDDCAYLKDLGIVVTQDSLVEDVHFSLDYMTPYQLGYKSVMVNLSDIAASGAEPKYLTIALSLPKNIQPAFVEDFYEGAKVAAQNVKIVGGDITGSEKIYISVTAIGSDKNCKISSRANAKSGYKIIVSGEHGNSAKGLEILKETKKITNKDTKFIQAHLMPEAQIEFSKQISTQIKEDYAMMDSSDGLFDALMQIAQSSNVLISVEKDRIPRDSSVEWEKVLFGGEDYQLVAAVPENLLPKIKNYTVIGEVKSSSKSGIELDGDFFSNIDNKLYNHFED